jgi:hypothetical protein
MMAERVANYLLQAIYFVILPRFPRTLEDGIFAGAFECLTLTARYGPLGTDTVLLGFVRIDKGECSFYWDICVGNPRRGFD